MGFFGPRSKQTKRLSVDERARARQSVKQAKARLERARTEARLDANEFARDEEGDLEMQGKLAQVKSATAWYMFWQKSNRMPKELELWSGEKCAWEDAAVATLEAVLQAADESPGVHWTPAKKVFWTSDITCETSTTRRADGYLYVRARGEVAIPPRSVLLTQTRAELRGEADPSLIYMREHYKFPYGRTRVVHEIVRSGGPFAPRDYCDLLTWDELPDKRIIVAQQSVVNCVPTGVVKGAVRGVHRLLGMIIEPAQIEQRSLFNGTTTVDGSRVTFVSCVDPKGWIPKSLYNLSAKRGVGTFLLNSEKVALGLAKQEGKTEELLERHVELPAQAGGKRPAVTFKVPMSSLLTHKPELEDYPDSEQGDLGGSVVSDALSVRPASSGSVDLSPFESASTFGGNKSRASSSTSAAGAPPAHDDDDDVDGDEFDEPEDDSVAASAVSAASAPASVRTASAPAAHQDK